MFQSHLIVTSNITRIKKSSIHFIAGTYYIDSKLLIPCKGHTSTFTIIMFIIIINVNPNITPYL